MRARREDWEPAPSAGVFPLQLPGESAAPRLSASEVPMAVGIDGGGGDRKKPLHAELNLVLLTPVWTQLVRLKMRW